jgi:hypothetical protein
MAERDINKTRKVMSGWREMAENILPAGSPLPEKPKKVLTESETQKEVAREEEGNDPVDIAQLSKNYKQLLNEQKSTKKIVCLEHQVIPNLLKIFKNNWSLENFEIENMASFPIKYVMTYKS